MKKNPWNEAQACNWLEKTSDVGIEDNCIFVNQGRLFGLKSCSALDFLIKHCKYKVVVV